MKAWKIEIRPGKDGGFVLRMIADAGDRTADKVAKRIERLLARVTREQSR